MAGRGPAPQAERRRTNEPARGEWKASSVVGWQYGEVPPAPTRLVRASRQVWATWFAAWFAAHWTRDDLPGLRTVIRLYDQVERGEFQRAGELRLQMDTYGITPKGQQDRRWVPPRWQSTTDEVPEPEAESGDEPKTSHYGHLRALRKTG